MKPPDNLVDKQLLCYYCGNGKPNAWGVHQCSVRQGFNKYKDQCDYWEPREGAKDDKTTQR